MPFAHKTSKSKPKRTIAAPYAPPSTDPRAVRIKSSMRSTPPDVVLPSFDPGFIMPSTTEYQGFHPSERELAAASTAIADLARWDGYSSALGTAAPGRADVAEALTLGLAWRGHREPAEQWATFVKVQDGMAWKHALTLLADLKPFFLLAVKGNPSLAAKYKGLRDLFEAPSVSAKLSAATRKKKAAAKKKEQAKAAAAAAKAARKV